MSWMIAGWMRDYKQKGRFVPNIKMNEGLTPAIKREGLAAATQNVSKESVLGDLAAHYRSVNQPGLADALVMRRRRREAVTGCGRRIKRRGPMLVAEAWAKRGQSTR